VILGSEISRVKYYKYFCNIMITHYDIEEAISILFKYAYEKIGKEINI